MSETVVIAGGGPTGLMLACELGLAGVSTVVLDRRTDTPPMSHGMAVHGRTLELFRQRGFADRIRSQDIFPWPRTPFSLLWLDISAATEEEYTYAYPQWRTEELLAGRAGELGVDLRRGHEVVGLTQDDAGVTVDVRSVAGDYQIRGAYVVGCDGAESAVRREAQIPFPALDGGYYGVLGDMDITAGGDHLFDAGLHPNGVFGAMPLNAEVIRLMTLEFDVEPPAADTPATAEELADRIERVTGRRPELGSMRWVSRFGSPTRLAERYRAGRVFLAGDAAHSLFISGTQGLNTGIHDAANLGWKLAAAVRGWAPAGLLDSYHEERQPVGQRMCWHARATTALLHPLERVRELRELMTGLIGFEEANRHLLRIPTDVRYPLEEPESAATPPHPLLGRPVPDAPLVTAGGPERLFHTLHSGQGVLLDLSGGGADRTDAAGWTGRVQTVVAEPSPETTAKLGAATVLVRPDGVVAHADPTGADGDGLRRALTRWFGEPAAATDRPVTAHRAGAVS